ncbi:uncharacterized protein PSFLO_01043 [Pseudozyma flocculosa]|uniref:Uncharacterized protein n=1 Tax=Pseudozyma flocculosa TaxID=84751 RepID=A0A5C3EU61_9BASI|nr:uncharacterized protein PSFLO_01043 [Pseudozyma flocculosa]
MYKQADRQTGRQARHIIREASSKRLPTTRSASDGPDSGSIHMYGAPYARQHAAISVSGAPSRGTASSCFSARLKVLAVEAFADSDGHPYRYRILGNPISARGAVQGKRSLRGVDARCAAAGCHAAGPRQHLAPFGGSGRAGQNAHPQAAHCTLLDRHGYNEHPAGLLIGRHVGALTDEAKARWLTSAVPDMARDGPRHPRTSNLRWQQQSDAQPAGYFSCVLPLARSSTWLLAVSRAQQQLGLPLLLARASPCSYPYGCAGVSLDLAVMKPFGGLGDDSFWSALIRARPCAACGAFGARYQPAVPSASWEGREGGPRSNSVDAIIAVAQGRGG